MFYEKIKRIFFTFRLVQTGATLQNFPSAPEPRWLNWGSGVSGGVWGVWELSWKGLGGVWEESVGGWKGTGGIREGSRRGFGVVWGLVGRGLGGVWGLSGSGLGGVWKAPSHTSIPLSDSHKTPPDPHQTPPRPLTDPFETPTRHPP